MTSPKTSASKLGLLFVVDKREAKLLQTNQNLALIRKTFPVAMLRELPLFVYFIEKGTNGRVIATGECTFAMRTLGEPPVLRKAHLTTKLFERNFLQSSTIPIAWEFENILPYTDKLSAFDFMQVVSEKKTFKPVTSIPRGWAYILC